jgi:hypothetical protein
MVSTVVARKTDVRRGEDRLPIIATTTIRPAAIATRLIRTCSVVKVFVESPRIMASSPSGPSALSIPDSS